MSGVFVFGPDLACRFANVEARRSIGRDCVAGMSPWEIKPFCRRDHIAGMFERAAQEQCIEFDTWHRHIAGFIFPVRVSLAHFGDQFVAKATPRGCGILGEIAGELEDMADGLPKTGATRSRYYAAVLRALSLGFGAASVLSPESAASMLAANDLFASVNS